MMRTLTGVAAIALTIGIGACTSHTGDTGSDSTPSTTQTEEKTTDDMYLDVLDDDGVPNVDSNRDNLIEMGKAACTDLDDGQSIEDLADQVVGNLPDGWTYENVGTVIGAGIAAYCPEHQDQIDALDGADT